MGQMHSHRRWWPLPFLNSGLNLVLRSALVSSKCMLGDSSILPVKMVSPLLSVYHVKAWQVNWDHLRCCDWLSCIHFRNIEFLRTHILSQLWETSHEQVKYHEWRKAFSAAVLLYIIWKQKTGKCRLNHYKTTDSDLSSLSAVFLQWQVR